MDSSGHEQEPAPCRSQAHSGGPSPAAFAHQGGGALEVRGETDSPDLAEDPDRRERLSEPLNLRSCGALDGQQGARAPRSHLPSLRWLVTGYEGLGGGRVEK